MRVLFLTKGDFMENQNEGGLACRYRNYDLIKKAVGEENTYVCAVIQKERRPEARVRYFYEKQDIVSRYIHYLGLRDGISGKTERKISQYIREVDPDVVFFDGSTWGNTARSTENRKKIVFFHNIERQYTWDRVRHGSILCIFRYLATRVCERRQVAYADQYICLNERDHQLLHHFYNRSADLILPITFQDTWEEGSQSGEEDFLLFVGSYFDANVQGIKWFISKVMPDIDLKLKIVGKGMEQLKGKDIDPEKVEIVGRVDSLSPYYKNALAVVMPIFIGGGMKVKTAEALMYGKTVFGTREAFEGYQTAGTEGLYQCNNAAEFIESIRRFQARGGPKFHEKIRNLFLDHYETDAYISKISGLLQS